MKRIFLSITIFKRFLEVNSIYNLSAGFFIDTTAFYNENAQKGLWKANFACVKINVLHVWIQRTNNYGL